MATTTTTVNLLGRAFPFIGIGVPAAQVITGIPSAELVFSSPFAGNAVTVAAAGEDQNLFINMPLPRSFCYVLVEASMRYAADDASDWDQSATCVMVDSATVPETVITTELVNSQLAHILTLAEVRQYTMPYVPSKVIVPLAADDANLSISLFNAVIDGSAGTAYIYARFLRYDRIQAQYWPINTPQLIR